MSSLFSVGGLASGLDSNAIVTQLLALERIPINQARSKQTALRSVDNAWSDIVTRLSAVRTAVDKLKTSADYGTHTSVTSSSDAVAVTRGGSPVPGGLSFTVSQLASTYQGSLSGSTSLSSGSDLVGAGTLRIRHADGSTFTEIDTEGRTLAQVAAAIQGNSELQANASVQQASDGTMRLLISSRRSGTDGGLERTAVAIHERFARETAAALSRVTRSEVEVAVSASEWMSFGEYLGCVPDPAVLAQVELPGSPAGMLVGLDTGTGLRVIDRLLGGSGAPAPPRGPTELELDLITDVLGTTVGAVGEVFGPTLTSPPQLSRVSTQPQLLRMVALTEPALVLTYRVSLALTPPAEGLLSLCYPAGAMGVLLGEVGRPADAPHRATGGAG